MHHVRAISRTQQPVKAASLLAKEHQLANVLTGITAAGSLVSIFGTIAGVLQGFVAVWQEVLDAINNADTHDN
jgi:hypothetical protein